MSNCYLTYLSNDRDYKGALLLNFMLKKYNSDIPLACIVLENVSDKIKKILIENNIIIHEFNLNEILTEFNFSEEYKKYIINKHYYGKYIIFRLINYQKIIYLDTDLLIKSSIDELFSLECSNGEIYMTYDTLLAHNNHVKFYTKFVNSGVIVLSPSIETYNYCYNSLKKYDRSPIPVDKSALTSDQTVFNDAIKLNELNIKYLPYKYNCIWCLVDELLNSNILNEVKVVHFILSPKPWDYIDYLVSQYCYSNSSKYLLEWIELYNLMVLENYKKCFSKNIYREYSGFSITNDGEILNSIVDNL